MAETKLMDKVIVKWIRTLATIGNESDFHLAKTCLQFLKDFAESHNDWQYFNVAHQLIFIAWPSQFVKIPISEEIK